MVNGVLSDSFKIIRGVRQGDAMSCLLFDIAIEPLATLLRTTGFQGYRTPTMPRSAIVSMFADDTMVFLRKGDSFYALQCFLDLNRDPVPQGTRCNNQALTSGPP